jgi:iron complex outermembrane receptor protein
VPILADPERSQAGERLALTLAARYDHTGDFGGKATWQSGLLWRTTESLSFSASYGISYRAPQLQEISGGTVSTTGNFGLIDPFRGGQPVPSTAEFTLGANPNLKPETGDSRTLGIVYRTSATYGFQGSLTYFAVNIANYIAEPNPQTIIDNPGLYPGGVIRGPATPQDQSLGYLGPITQILYSNYNFGDLRVAGFDADLSYSIDTGLGLFTPSLALSNIYKWQSALVPGSPLVSYVSQATYSGVGFAPRWKGIAGLAWKRGPLSANLAGRYVGEYRDYQDAVPNTNELGNNWIFDLNARFEFGEVLGGGHWLAGTYVAVGAINLFDKRPPFSYGYLPYDAAEYDIRGRMVYAQGGIKW